jgi:hypothetical protein
MMHILLTVRTLAALTTLTAKLSHALLLIGFVGLILVRSQYLLEFSFVFVHLSIHLRRTLTTYPCCVTSLRLTLALSATHARSSRLSVRTTAARPHLISEFCVE